MVQTKFVLYFFWQGNVKQKTAGNGVSGVELRQFESAAAKGAAGRPQQFRRGVPSTRAQRCPHSHDPARIERDQGSSLRRLSPGQSISYIS